MRIGVDLDGVVYDYVDDFRNWVSFATERPLSDFPDAETWTFYKDQWDLTTPEFLTLMAQGPAAGKLFLDGKEVDGASHGIKALRDAGDSIHIVTNRPDPGACEATCQWLATTGVAFDSLTFSADKTVVPVDVFIEDNVENYLAIEAAGIKAVMFDRPWNRHLAGADRVSTWSQFVLRIDEIESAGR